MKLRIFGLLTVLVALGLVSNSFASATLFWGNNGSGFLAYESNGTTPINGDASSAIGGFVQLLYLGADGLYNGFTDSGSGVNGDDQVAQTLWMGQGAMNNDGLFTGTYVHSLLAGAKFTMLFFSSPSPNFAGGAVPTTGTYGQSQVFSTTADPNLAGTDAFAFNQNYSATTAVPEPSTIALMIAGLGILAGRRFLRS